VALDYDPEGITITVSDDGDGFDVATATAQSQAGTSLGLRTLRERVERAGGEIGITSRPGHGCVVMARIPS